MYSIKPTLFKNNYGEFRGWVVAIFVILLVGGLSTAILTGVNAAQRIACEDAASLMEREHDYGFWSGCLVKGDDGKFLPIESIREPEHR